MRSVLLALVLSSCANPGVQGRYVSVAPWRPCTMAAITVTCSTNLPERGCRQLIRAIRWVNKELPGALVYGGQRGTLPGHTPTAMNVVIVGYRHVHDGVKDSTFMQTSVLPDRVTACAVWTWIEVQRDLTPMSDDYIHLAFAHELLHVMGINHTPMTNTVMAASAPDFAGEPSIDPALASTLDALYPMRRFGVLN